MSDKQATETQLNDLRAALAEKERQIAELQEKLAHFDKTVADVRHDTNNPLAVVIGQAQFLTSRIGNLPEDVMRRLRVIEEMSQRIKTTLNLLQALKQKPPES